MLSQFVGGGAMRMLGALDFNFPEGIHAVGRLDNLSEGLLLLTTNKRVTKLLFQDLEKPHRRTYLVQVYRHITEENIHRLRTGIPIIVKGGESYITAPCEVEQVTKPASLFTNGCEFREDLPHSWLRISLTEGKYHQIRKMTAAISHRCVRLIRESIEDLALDGLLPGEVREMDEQQFFSQLHITDWQKEKHPFFIL